MREPVNPLTEEQAAARRKGVRRTVWAVGAIALAIYLLFLLSGIFGK
jgi:hypothetical protein